MPSIGISQLRTVLRRMERLRGDDALTTIAPHIRYVEIKTAIAIVIEPGGAHAWTDVLDSGFARNIPEFSAFIPVQIVAAKVVGDVQAWPATPVVVGPGCGEAIA